MNPNKALWEKGDFTRVAQSIRRSGESFVKGLGITKGIKVLDLGCGDGTTALPAAARLMLAGAGASARAWQAILDLPWYRRPGAVLHEAFPSPAFIRRAVPGTGPGLPGLTRGYWRRWRRIAAEVRR